MRWKMALSAPPPPPWSTSWWPRRLAAASAERARPARGQCRLSEPLTLTSLLQDSELCSRGRHIPVEEMEHQHKPEPREPGQSHQPGEWPVSVSAHLVMCCRGRAGRGSTDSGLRRRGMWASGRYRQRATSRGGCALRTASVRAGRICPW